MKYATATQLDTNTVRYRDLISHTCIIPGRNVFCHIFVCFLLLTSDCLKQLRKCVKYRSSFLQSHVLILALKVRLCSITVKPLKLRTFPFFRYEWNNFSRKTSQNYYHIEFKAQKYCPKYIKFPTAHHCKFIKKNFQL